MDEHHFCMAIAKKYGRPETEVLAALRSEIDDIVDWNKRTKNRRSYQDAVEAALDRAKNWLELPAFGYDGSISLNELIHLVGTYRRAAIYFSALAYKKNNERSGGNETDKQ